MADCCSNKPLSLRLITMLERHYISVELLQKQVHNRGSNSRTVAMPQGECSPEQNSNTVDCRYSGLVRIAS